MNNIRTHTIRAKELTEVGHTNTRIFIAPNTIINVREFSVSNKGRIHFKGTHFVHNETIHTKGANWSKAYDPEQKIEVIFSDDFTVYVERLTKAEEALEAEADAKELLEAKQEAVEIGAYTVKELKKLLATRNDNEYVVAVTDDNDRGFLTKDNIGFV